MIKILMALLLGYNVYPTTAKIVEFDDKSNAVICESATEIQYKFYGIEDYEIGDCVSMIVSDNGTENTNDDIVLVSRYSSWSLSSRN